MVAAALSMVIRCCRCSLDARWNILAHFYRPFGKMTDVSIMPRKQSDHSAAQGVASVRQTFLQPQCLHGDYSYKSQMLLECHKLLRSPCIRQMMKNRWAVGTRCGQAWKSGGVVGEKVKGCPSFDSLLPSANTPWRCNEYDVALALAIAIAIATPRLVLKISPMYREVTPSQLLVSRYEDGKVRRVAM